MVQIIFLDIAFPLVTLKAMVTYSAKEFRRASWHSLFYFQIDLGFNLFMSMVLRFSNIWQDYIDRVL